MVYQKINQSNAKEILRGSFVALVTPFKRDNAGAVDHNSLKPPVDYDALKPLVDCHMKSKMAGIVPCGTTGESPTLDHEEQVEIIKRVIEFVDGHKLVIPGTGSNSTYEAVKLTKAAELAGADAALVICPYYNKPTQEGLYQHYKVITQESNLPLIIYNIPSRTAVNMVPETMARIYRDFPTVVGIKEASGNIDQMSKIISLCGNKIALLSGDDALTFDVLSIGGTGVISVVANLFPNETAEMIEAFERGDPEEAEKIHRRMLPLVKMLFIETNPVPIKTAMEILNMCLSGVRLPLVPMSEENKAKLANELEKFIDAGHSERVGSLSNVC